MLTEIIRPITGATDGPDPPPLQRPKSVSGGGYLKFRNDRGVPEICIGVREFKCIGCPHRRTTRTSISIWASGTRFRFDPRLTPFEVDPPDSFFADDGGAGARQEGRLEGPIKWAQGS